MQIAKPVSECAACQDNGLLTCTCDYYATWPKGKKPRARQASRHPGRFYREGHRAGRVDACRRLYGHLDAEGRTLAAAIAVEGDGCR